MNTLYANLYLQHENTEASEKVWIQPTITAIKKQEFSNIHSVQQLWSKNNNNNNKLLVWLLRLQPKKEVIAEPRYESQHITSITYNNRQLTLTNILLALFG